MSCSDLYKSGQYIKNEDDWFYDEWYDLGPRCIDCNGYECGSYIDRNFYLAGDCSGYDKYGGVEIHCGFYRVAGEYNRFSGVSLLDEW